MQTIQTLKIRRKSPTAFSWCKTRRDETRLDESHTGMVHVTAMIDRVRKVTHIARTAPSDANGQAIILIGEEVL